MCSSKKDGFRLLRRSRQHFTVEELALYFNVDRKTMAKELKRCGVDLRDKISVLNYLTGDQNATQSGERTLMVAQMGIN